MKEMIEKTFRQMGARVQVTLVPEPGDSQRRRPKRRRRSGSDDERFRAWNWQDLMQPIRVDVRRDSYGEYFDLCHRHNVRVSIPDCAPKDRHLLLVAQTTGRRADVDAETFLCGHDERAWFVAAIPETAAARSVQGAKDALKPPEVWDAMRRFNVSMDRRDRRRTAAFARQGEWFFIPQPGMVVPDHQVLHNEPIRRGAGKPHVCQFLHRVDGEMVYVNSRHPNGVTPEEFEKLPPSERFAPGLRQMVRGAHVYVRGSVRHPDHATIWLTIWHEVVMNTETKARAMQHVAFLD